MNQNFEQGMQVDMDVEEVSGAHARVLTDEQARELVLRVVAEHADSLLKTARRHSLCADDAHDAYQRTMEIFVRRAATLDPERAYRWVHTVCKHEAMAVRAQRQQLVSSEEPDLDREEARHLPSPEEQLVSFDRLRRSAEALQRLKPQELRALWLKAEGFSYAEICEQTGWTHTKVNRCITEGRRAFLARYARIEGGDECERWLPVLSAVVDGEASAEQLLEIRPHLRNCSACRATVRELHATSAPLAALLPVPLVPAAVAGHARERAAGALVRLYEAAVNGVHERAASATLKVQAAAEAASAGKLAAIAASAAAIAGGGAVVVQGSVDAGRPPVARARVTPRPVSAAAPVAAVAPPSAVAPGRTTTVANPAPRARRSARREFAVRRTHAATARTEFVSASTATAAPASSPAVYRGSPEPPAANREFASEFGG